ncbi:hypothetical protein CBS147482_3431 [Aspergillus niger]|nr:hypothetical protein CBS133816_3915 [Aspergillus niger]KAI2846582.1 hypothetical protein CBS11350_3615 [Aspergillus niger]KAI2976229.1 hypothetical protein CBS147324_2629 [Aspergillus niger]KAI3015253.1 hypothetical protein CBS147482_3431 [Aspergillus niger]
MSAVSLTNQTRLRLSRGATCFKPSTLASRRLFSSSSSARFSLQSSTRTAVAPSFLRPTPFIHSRRAFFHTSSTMSHKVHDITSKAEFAEKVTNSTDAIVLDCFATWCGPCKAISPKVEEFSNTYPNAKFYKIDVDELSEVAAELGIRAMPTFLLFKDGKKFDDLTGANPKGLEQKIQALLA